MSFVYGRRAKFRQMHGGPTVYGGLRVLREIRRQHARETAAKKEREERDRALRPRTANES